MWKLMTVYVEVLTELLLLGLLVLMESNRGFIMNIRCFLIMDQ